MNMEESSINLMNRSIRTGFLLLIFCPLCVFWSNAAQSQDGVYSGRIRADSVFYNNQLSFISRDTALFFLDNGPSRLREIPCATYYRVAPLNKYYQQNGLVTDYYLDNDSVAARLSYKDGILDGPCVFFYRNGQIREKGSYGRHTRTGNWDYYFENGGMAKTIRFTDTGVYLMDCFKETGERIARDGNGQFDGIVLAGKPSSPIELRMRGPVKNGVLDGEWQLTGRYSSEPFSVEQFSSGKFLHGTSSSYSGKQEYDKDPLSAIESVHALESLDHYGYNDFCLTAGKTGNLGGTTPKAYAEIGDGVRKILKSGKYRDYGGWILLDIHYDEAGRVSAKSVRLYQENEAFHQELLSMLGRLPKPGRLTLDGTPTLYERFFVVLVEGNTVVIPEEVLDKRLRAFLFGQN
jgi:antitoxin component YwqK of YwqJK toxin-antitoxin module